MIQLWPSQYRPFVRRVIRYALLLALLQMMGILVVAALVPSPPGSGINGFQWLFILWLLWLLQLAAGVILGWLFFRLVVKVVCPNCLARLSFRRRHQRYPNFPSWTTKSTSWKFFRTADSRIFRGL
jgi:hypothetical protein